MGFGDLLAKLAKGDALTPEEREELRLTGNQTELNGSYLAGLRNGQSDILARSIDALNFPLKVIYSKILEADVASVTIQIPSNYKHLIVFAAAATNKAALYDYIDGRFNGDSGTNYMEGFVGESNGSGAGWTGEVLSATGFGLSFAASASSSAGAAGSTVLFIPHYNSNAWKTGMKIAGIGNTYTSFLTSFIIWKNTAPVKQITLYPDGGTVIKANSIFSIYGVL